MDDPNAVPPVVDKSNLPEGVSFNNDYKSDIDRLFDGPEGAGVTTDKPAPIAKDQPPPGTPPPVETKTEPQPGSLAAKLAGKKAPVVATVVTDTKPESTTSPELDPVSKIEAEFKKHDPKWKPAVGWDQLKALNKTEAEKRISAERERDELKAHAAAPFLDGMTADDIKALKAREKAASDRLMVLALEEHPSFRAQYVDPKNAEIEKANELLRINGVKGDVSSLINKPRAEIGKAVTEMLKDMPEFDRVETAEAIRRAYSLDQAGKVALTNSKELQRQIQGKTIERQREAFDRTWLPVSAAIGEHAVEVEIPADAPAGTRAALEDYNASLKGLRTEAEKIAFSPMTDEGIAENAIKAAAYNFHIQKAMPRIISEYEEVVNLNRQLVAELNALRGRNPNHAISGTTAVGEGGSKDPSQMNAREAADYYFNKK